MAQRFGESVEEWGVRELRVGDSGRLARQEEARITTSWQLFGAALWAHQSVVDARVEQTK
jgi:hypothetical protein